MSDEDLLDLMAANALMGLLADPLFKGEKDHAGIAQESYKYAAAMMVEKKRLKSGKAYAIASK